MKKIIFFILFVSFVIVFFNSSNTSPNTTFETTNSFNNTIIFENRNIENTTIETSTTVEDNIIYLEDYPSFIEECFKNVSPNYSFLDNAYSISVDYGNFVSIYFYSDKYYSLSTYSDNIISFSKELLDEISKKQYQKKLFQPENVLLQIKYCGYGKDLNSGKIHDNTQPLAALNIYTDDLKSDINLLEYITNNIDIYDYWF